MSGEHDSVPRPADFPPGIDAPAPPAERNRPAPADITRDIRQLADRVGGLDRLRELVTELARTPR
ncbi:MAG TPA: hypothetical protein VH092_36060 [Urbifossiella sp.]|jgi:hypothetical protein|nr:hypothetical protein [Urbifossiella sp.]